MAAPGLEEMTISLFRLFADGRRQRIVSCSTDVTAKLFAQIVLKEDSRRGHRFGYTFNIEP